MNGFLLIGLTLFFGSCTIFSLHPLYEEADLLEDPRLTGLWQDTDDGDEYVQFKEIDNKKYLFRYMERQGNENSMDLLDTVSFEAGLLKVGDHYFLDLYPYYEGEEEEDYYLFRNFIPAHSFLKIEYVEDNILLYLFNYDRLKMLFEQNRIRIKHELIESGKVTDYIVITASTEDLKRFIRKYADDKEAFDDPGEFKKIK
jgi:hypothetical protein